MKRIVVTAMVIALLSALVTGCSKAESGGIVVTATDADGGERAHVSVTIDNHGDETLKPASIVVADKEGKEVTVQTSDPIASGEQVTMDSVNGTSIDKSASLDDGLISMEINWDE